MFSTEGAKLAKSVSRWLGRLGKVKTESILESTVFRAKNDVQNDVQRTFSELKNSEGQKGSEASLPPSNSSIKPIHYSFYSIRIPKDDESTEHE